MAASMPFIPEAISRECIDWATGPRPEWVHRLADEFFRQRRKKRARQFVVNVRALQRWKAAYDG